ncbi:YpiF family protein [Pseudalkalibacillus berkeleyi]|uniref:YpiF family protein n=1 Tax=Pseudalkalibacillus berkeleyi TaxID=1069813 RepID=A0ABS9GXS3_9BACL|nr:YpiF family protein [Pseudalkalibacillus berkeleyi]MCF6137567.1 YpiF family protein [Pseudalkalibacillus berkeleyi]
MDTYKEVKIMKWRSKDIDVYNQASEYVDTAVVPLIPISWGQNKKNIVLKGEFPQLVSDELERQLKGRVVLFPPITYLESEKDEEILNRMEVLFEELKESDMPYPVFITSDVRWSGSPGLQEHIVTIPPVPLEHMEEEYQREVISEQVKHLLQIVTKKWQNSF